MTFLPMVPDHRRATSERSLLAQTSTRTLAQRSVPTSAQPSGGVGSAIQTSFLSILLKQLLVGIRSVSVPTCMAIAATFLLFLAGMVTPEIAIASPLVSSISTPSSSLVVANLVSEDASRLTAEWADLSASDLVSYLPPGNAIKDGKALLRYSLPIDNKPIRKVQKELEDISNLLRVQGSRPMAPIKGNLRRANLVLKRSEKILADIPDGRKSDAEVLLTSIETGIVELQAYTEESNRSGIYAKRAEVLDTIGELEALMVTEFPFEIPDEYSRLPRLLGRATVEMETDYGTMSIVLDGYSAPLTAGNFVDLVQRGFYDGLEFNRVEDFYVVQAGDPPGPEDGFIDPDTGEERTIPLEILVKGDEEPIYGYTLEQMGVTLDDPILPFSSFGTLAMARPDRDVNGGSSQFFFLKFESELTPAGINLLDGEYAVFGYAVENKDILREFQVGDRIKSMRVVEGAENFVQPT